VTRHLEVDPQRRADVREAARDEPRSHAGEVIDFRLVGPLLGVVAQDHDMHARSNRHRFGLLASPSLLIGPRRLIPPAPKCSAPARRRRATAPPTPGPRGPTRAPGSSAPAPRAPPAAPGRGRPAPAG